MYGILLKIIVIGIGTNMDYITKDSGKRMDYSSGMHRDDNTQKPDFSLLLTNMPYDKQMLTRWAGLMTRGANKYGKRNWELACTQEELDRFKSSAMRHFMQWITGETDEDHASAIYFNVQAAEYVKWRLENETQTKDIKC